jgi:hypothetical protein
MSLQHLPPVDDAHVELLKVKLGSPETQWVERKAKGDDKVIRKALVAFANSVRDGEWAVLFLGSVDNGDHPGVRDPDEVQRGAMDLAQNHCYPPIAIRPVVFSVSVRGQPVAIVAIEVPSSTNRPHFAGQSFVRIGSSSVPASAAQFEELIASRNDKIRKLQQIPRSVIFRVCSTRGLWFEFDGTFDSPKPGESLKVAVHGSGGTSLRVRIEDLEIISTADWIKPVLLMKPLGTEQAHIMDMLNAWRNAQHGEHLSIDPSDEIIKQLIPFAPEVCILMAQRGWADAQNFRERPVFDFFDLQARRYR